PNNYGPKTEQAVKEFQAYYEFNQVDGIANEHTLSKLAELLDNALFVGDRKERVTQLKDDLNFLGFPVSMNTPNSYGPKTEQAVKDVEIIYGLKVTGIAEEKVLNLVDELMSQPMKKGLKRQDVIELKENLNKIGFTVSMNTPNSY